MAHTKTENIDALTDVVRRSARGLSERAVATLVAHPSAVSSALAAAAGALGTVRDTAPAEPFTLSGDEPRMLNEETAKARLDARTRATGEPALLTSDEVASLADLRSRQTVHDWLRADRVVGWRGAKRGVVFPAEQFDARGRPPEGLVTVLPLFPDGHAAWVWIVAPSSALDGARPLDILREGRTDDVVAAAKGDAQGDFA